MCSLRLIPALLALAALATLPACTEAPHPAWSGYAEGDYLYIASPSNGQLLQLPVAAGQWVQKGATLFMLDDAAERAAQDEGSARLRIAQAQVANTDKGKRQPEIDVTRAQINQMHAAVNLARDELSRQQQLAVQGFVAAARVTDAQTALRQAQARLDESSAALHVARLPAREDERQAAQANAAAAAAALQQSQWRTQQKKQTAPLDAQVSEVFYQVGEIVAAGQPVLALLPPAQVLARFYVPQSALAGITLGLEVQVSCDGCANPIAARVTHIASQAEFTPPVIYSNAQRAKMMFMVQARPDQPGRLHPGQPLDVRVMASGSVP